VPTLSLKQRTIKLDDRKWEAATRYVRAYSEWQLALKAFGLWSPMEREAFENVEDARKKYNRLAKANVR
jgi:hypothetical protein